MTISTSVRRAGPFTGTGQAVDYPFSFKVFSPSDVRPYQADADGNERRLQYNTDYSVTLNANQETHPGGVVRLTAALARGNRLTIISEMPIAQPTVFTNQGGFYPRTLNDSLDRLTIYVQQLEEMVRRSVNTGVNSDGVPAIPRPSPGRFLRWNQQGKLANINLVDLMSNDANGEDSKIATIAALKKVSAAADAAKRTLEGSIRSVNTEVDNLERSLADLRRLVQTTGGTVPDAFVRRLETAERNATSATRAASEAKQAATEARGVAGRALPTAGGTLTGLLQLDYHEQGSGWMGIRCNNTSKNPAGVFLDACREGTIDSRLGLTFDRNGSSGMALQLSPAGDPAQSRRQDVLKVDHDGIWHKLYGDLHQYFARSADIFHQRFPSHYNGAEVWWHKKLRLKICMMDIITEGTSRFGVGNVHDIRLPVTFPDRTMVITSGHTTEHGFPISATARKVGVSLLRAQGWAQQPRTKMSFLIIGYAEQ
ncbi:MAG: hypothetical protein Q4A06_00050 [Cardiobacteriaceae bacterium]|nr:hypothetical protein [Cardiobacteriaceae bacterium]